MKNKVLVVDLDGSLVKSDTLLESFLLLMKANVFWCVLIPFWLLKGKANLKKQIAQRVEFDARWLPYNQQVLDWVTEQKQQGVACYLATGANIKIAQAVSDYLQLFDGVFASDDQTNLTGSRKAQRLNQEFGKGNYSYVGNEAVDLAIWRDCEQAIVVTAKQRLLQQAKQVCADVVHINNPQASVMRYIKAIRVHQWIKNVLILVPILTAHVWLDVDWLVVLAGFLSFSLAASSVYVLNDLLDLPSDRQHPSKRKRPFAAGDIPLTHGILLLPVLLLATAALLVFTPWPFIVALAIYYAVTVAYSFGLKKVIMLDAVVLAILYTLRIVAGTLLIGVPFSFWLLAFSLFIFQSLALVKRYTELVMLKEQGANKTVGRGYHAEDGVMVAALGAASGYIAVLVFALYVNNFEVLALYNNPSVLWLACPILLYWISRVWLIAHRGDMHDDPIVFAVKDKQSLLVGVLVLLVFGLAL